MSAHDREHSYRWAVAGRDEDAAGDRTPIVVMGDDHPTLSRSDWLGLLASDGPTGIDAQAAELVRALREHCEGDDTRRP